MKFEYIWTEHTLIRNKYWEKEIVYQWEIIETEIDLCKTARCFKRVDWLENKKLDTYLNRQMPNFENKEVDWIKILREKYENKYKKPVPTPFKNNIQWIISKISN
jgi:hypothetical protein